MLRCKIQNAVMLTVLYSQKPDNNTNSGLTPCAP